METTPAPTELSSKLESKKHISFLLRCLHLLPQPYTSADDQRMTLGYFALASLDLLNSLDKIPAEEREELLEWVYAQQSTQGGFRGSPSINGGANVAMTYSALLILAILKDDFARLDRGKLLRYIGALQDTDAGGFAAEEGVGTEVKGEGELGTLVDRDPRFTYCAVAICSMLGEWSSIDVGKARRYLEGCQRYDGGFGASEAHESHSGMTYCCVAALHLLPSSPSSASSSYLPSSTFPRQDEALSWLVHRQVAHSYLSVPIHTPPNNTSNTQAEDSDSEEGEEEELAGGFQGRPCKLPPDVCYSFWNGAALSTLGQHELVDAREDAGYVLSAQSRVGGISKVPGDHPDLLHTYLGLASLALHQPECPGAEEEGGEQGIEFGMKPLDPAYNCSLDVKAWIQQHLTK